MLVTNVTLVMLSYARFSDLSPFITPGHVWGLDKFFGEGRNQDLELGIDFGFWINYSVGHEGPCVRAHGQPRRTYFTAEKNVHQLKNKCLDQKMENKYNLEFVISSSF